MYSLDVSLPLLQISPFFIVIYVKSSLLKLMVWFVSWLDPGIYVSLKPSLFFPKKFYIHISQILLNSKAQ